MKVFSVGKYITENELNVYLNHKNLIFYKFSRILFGNKYYIKHIIVFRICDIRKKNDLYINNKIIFMKSLSLISINIKYHKVSLCLYLFVL